MTQENEDTDRPTTEIEWRDAREEEPDDGTEILILDRGSISSSIYQDQGVYGAIAVAGDEEIQWSGVDFWTPIPGDLPSRGCILDVLNRQLDGWEACEDSGYEWSGTFKAMYIGNFDVEIEAHPRFDTAAVVELRAGNTTIKVEERATDTATSMEQGLSKVLRETKKEAARLDAITKQIDV